MSDDVCAFALKNALSEMKNVCPDITTSFIFRENGEIITLDQDTPQVAIANAQDALLSLSEKGETVGDIESIIGDIESITFEGEKSKANINRFQGLYVANVISNDADEKTVTNLTRIIIPCVLNVIQAISPSQKDPTDSPQKIEPKDTLIPNISPAEPQPLQLTVDHFGLGSMLKDTSLALIDKALIDHWNETLGEKKVAKISLENPVTGKSLICGFAVLKESKYEGKSAVQLSEKTRIALSVFKGEQVLVKPIIEQSEDANTTLNESYQISEEAPNQTSKHSSPAKARNSSEIPTEQFIVENVSGLGGLFGYNDYARVDNKLIAKWGELFGEKQIEQVIIEETISGRKLTCKFKPIKGAEFEGKGIIQLPEKIQQALQTKKGALVVVRPLVEE